MPCRASSSTLLNPIRHWKWLSESSVRCKRTDRGRYCKHGDHGSNIYSDRRQSCDSESYMSCQSFWTLAPSQPQVVHWTCLNGLDVAPNTDVSLSDFETVTCVSDRIPPYLSMEQRELFALRWWGRRLSLRQDPPWFEFLVIFDFFTPWYRTSREASSVKIS